MASVVGIDFGTLASKIGVARKKGIDIILNESSQRATPSLVSFGPKQRSIGEAAKTLETSNYKNTIGSLKRLAGRKLTDPDVSGPESQFINAKLVDIAGQVGVKVQYLGEPHEFTATQLVAMYLGKLRDIASNELKSAVSDVVIAVPPWFTDLQRRAILDAAQIAGLNPLRLINDITAVAFGYGITKSDLPEKEEAPRNVVFIDVGHSNYTASVVAFNKGQLVVRATAWDRHFGGRDVDLALVRHFAEEFKGTKKIDVLSNPKATFRLLAQTERLKKILSANSAATLSVESIMNDVDVSSKLTREQLEELVPEVLARATKPLEQLMKQADLKVEDIFAIELVGGSSRVPAIRQRISEFFGGKQLSSTLNADEAVARGATFSCAQLSPAFRLKDFAIQDVVSYPVKVSWEKDPSDADPDSEMVVFDKGNIMPSTKLLTFERSKTFDLEGSYADPSSLPEGTPVWLSKLTVKDPSPSGAPVTVKVKVRINANGLLSFEGAYVPEEEEDPTPAAEGEVKKKKVIKRTVQSVAMAPIVDTSILGSLREKENEMHASDKLVMDTEDRKNALEGFIYDVQSKIESSGTFGPFVQAEEKPPIESALTESLDWLFTEEGEDATKSAYVERLDALHKLVDPIQRRWYEHENRSKNVAALRDTLNEYLSKATSGEEKYDHIDEKDKQAVVEKVATIQKWLEDSIARQVEKPKNRDPVFTADELEKKRQEVIFHAVPIFSKIKPKPKTDVPAPESEKPKNDSAPPSGTETPAESQDGPSEMDVD